MKKKDRERLRAECDKKSDKTPGPNWRGRVQTGSGCFGGRLPSEAAGKKPKRR